MAFLARPMSALRPISRALYRPAATFHTSASRRALSEQDRDDDDRHSKIDHHQSDSIDRAKSGKGEWKPELASQSEQVVNGDKHNMSMEEMTKMGEQKAEEGKKPSGSSSSQGANKN
ncbi:hypothetical protein LTS08_003105 [Lithohypha guttulata]|uniref:Uncharacterized protein n=1 Tax=Lithohypha guttulata TaxID=1690604 RepID=A0AAN7SZ84_9EURO|nr:hypothetical protein LTR51_000239 [Lithohypha guttulata]KAK5085431.1 hypothetical protein LTR05_004716 [Lithohypha guttulata]KAK5103687.1 hypothetical protein LTS08_003105 [Lithohypha guttulata]